jgi:hypothetical protein
MKVVVELERRSGQAGGCDAFRRASLRRLGGGAGVQGQCRLHGFSFGLVGQLFRIGCRTIGSQPPYNQDDFCFLEGDNLYSDFFSGFVPTAEDGALFRRRSEVAMEFVDRIPPYNFIESKVQ